MSDATAECVNLCTVQASFESDYLEVCRRKRTSRESDRQPKSLAAVAEETLNDCIIVDEASGKEAAEQYRRRLKCKLLQFKENFRPAYWGTWRRKSSILSPRNPFRKDEVRNALKLSPGALLSTYERISTLCM